MTGDPAQPSRRVIEEAVGRVARADYPRWAEQVEATGGCVEPVRLAGALRRVEVATGHTHLAYDTAGEPDAVLLKACGTRRASRCPACAAIYRGDARALIAAGLHGGKGTPDAVADHPCVFATLTARSYGAVHHRHEHGRACQAGPGGTCAHGRSLTCNLAHAAGDPVLGSPICADCYDYAGAVGFNLGVTELWRRTTIAARRALARKPGMTVRAVARHHQLNYVKVVEYQQRGIIHLHALVRLDPAPGEATAPAEVLVEALASAVARTRAPHPFAGGPPLAWGSQSDIAVVTGDDRRRTVAYLAKYATKSAGDTAALDRRLRSEHHIDALAIPERLKTMVATCWRLGGRPELAGLHLQHWAHTLGYRGHWLTKSRHWSTTLSALRQARHDWQSAHSAGHPPDDTVEVGEWDYLGRGHASRGDTWLAQVAATNRALQRRTAWEER